MFWYVHLAFSVPCASPLVYRTKPIFNAGWASEARATDASPEANTKPVSEAVMKNDLNMTSPIFLCETSLPHALLQTRLSSSLSEPWAQPVLLIRNGRPWMTTPGHPLCERVSKSVTACDHAGQVHGADRHEQAST